ncbi:MAG: hypothetical protein HKN68_04605 [Saprospiraceae bacterium]|nr:hypothetical protein [Saprospiraceae bacterium]
MKLTFILLMLATAVNAQPINYSGGNGDGSFVAILIDNGSLYSNGFSDGASTAEYKSSGSVYRGGSFDGFNTSNLYNPNSFYAGADSDGFSTDVAYFYFVWDGSTGTGWNIASNWQTNAIPTEERRVRIPAGVPSFPYLNSGTLKVGSDTGTGTFQAKEIIIEPGALMIARINNFIENYGLICIEGVLELRNSNPLAFRNLNEATLLIKSGGELRTNY